MRDTRRKSFGEVQSQQHKDIVEECQRLVGDGPGPLHVVNHEAFPGTAGHGNRRVAVGH